MRRFVVTAALSTALMLILSAPMAWAQCGGGCGCPSKAQKTVLGGDGVKAAKSCPGCASGEKCAGCEAKAAQGGDGVKSAKAKSCPGCASGNPCPKCVAKAAQGGDGVKSATAKSCPGCAEGKMCAKCEAKAAQGGDGVKTAVSAKSGCAVCAAGRACASCAVKKAAKASKGGETKAAFMGNASCPIMGGKADPKQFVAYQDPKTQTYANIYMCCPACTDKIKADPAAAYKKAYLGSEVKNKKGKVIAKKGEPIALKNEKCPIMGGKVSPTVSLTYNGYKIGLCCAGCEKTFMKSPDKNLSKLVTQAATAKKKGAK